MSHLLLELLLWVLLAFFTGCVLGTILRLSFGAQQPLPAAVPAPAPAPEVKRVEAPEPKPAAAQPVVPPPAPRPAPAPAPLMTAEEPVPAGKPHRPKGIAKARGEKADNLQRISGIGPKNERVLHGLGIFHFDQIAAWTGNEVRWVDDHLRFNGRIEREEWIRQARLLAEGKEAEFLKLYGTGGLKSRDGEAKPGERTRRS